MKIISSKKICGGKPRINGTRITVSAFLNALARGMTIHQIIERAKKIGIKIKKNDAVSAIYFAVKKLNSKK